MLRREMLRRGPPLLTACWQQTVSITGQHSNEGDFVHDHSLRLRHLDGGIAAADTMVAAGGG
jgi:hypothetical protein